MYTHPKNTISGDLPIRSRRGDQESPQSPDIPDATPEQVIETAKKVMIDPKPRDFEQELASTAGTTVGKKKPRHKRPKSKRGHGKPTGFEEYYAEGPMTPKEYEETRKLYDPERPFIDRIEDALARFQYQRRIETKRRHIFLKYLQYGGVNAGQNHGQGVNDRDLEKMTPEQAIQARSQTSVLEEREKLEISFNKVVKGFLGSYFIRYFNPENEDSIKLATVTIRIFFTCLLYHDVCPEYNDDLLEARKTCDLATTELWKNLQLVRQAPGRFNRSCSIVYGGTYHETSGEKDEWGRLVNRDENTPTLQSACEVIQYGITSMGADERAKRFQELVHENKIEAKEIHDIDGFEVLTVTEPDAHVHEFYRANAPEFDPVGKITARSYRDPAKPDLDLSPEERREWDSGNVPNYEFEFLVELPLLKLFYPGLKVMTAVWEMNCGLQYFDDVISVYPTFYTVIANDLMLEWKMPKELTDAEAKKQEEW